MAKFDSTNNELNASGQLAQTIAASTLIKTGAARCCRILGVSGTGSLDIYDNTAGSGTKVYSKAAMAVGDSLVIDCPMVTGIYVALGATTTVTVIYT
jgi:hypothetical protein